MAAIEQKFAHFKTKAAFDAKLAAGEINVNGVTYIKETKQIYTHEAYYNCALTDAQVEALIKASIVNDLTSGGVDKSLSAEQGKVLKTALDAVEAALNEFKTQAEASYEKIANKNVANGYAGLDADGKLDPSLINGVVGHVVGLEDFVATNPTSVENEKKYFNTTTNKIIEGVDGAWVESDPKTEMLYARYGVDSLGHANTLHRWTGVAMVGVSDPLAIGEVVGTAYDGKKGADNRAAVLSLPNQVIAGPFTATADATKITISVVNKSRAAGSLNYADGTPITFELPVATASAAGLMSAADKAKIDAQLGTGDPGAGETLPEKIEALQNNTVNGKKISTNPVINGADVKLDGFTPLADDQVTEAQLTPVATDTVNVAIAKLLKAILDNEDVTATAINKINTGLGFDINGNYVPTDASLAGKNVTEAIDSIAALVKNAQTSEQVTTLVNTAITNLIGGATADGNTLKKLEDMIKAEIARATAAEAKALADAKAYVDAELGWYEGE